MASSGILNAHTLHHFQLQSCRIGNQGTEKSLQVSTVYQVVFDTWQQFLGTRCSHLSTQGTWQCYELGLQNAGASAALVRKTDKYPECSDLNILSPGTAVMYLTPPEKIWKPAKIIEYLGYRSYRIEADNGAKYVRSRYHLKPYTPQNNFVPDEASQPAQPSAPRTSGRMRRAPDKLNLWSNGTQWSESEHLKMSLDFETEHIAWVTIVCCVFYNLTLCFILNRCFEFELPEALQIIFFNFQRYWPGLWFLNNLNLYLLKLSDTLLFSAILFLYLPKSARKFVELFCKQC